MIEVLALHRIKADNPRLWMAVLFLLCFSHRVLQLWLLWPQLITAIGIAPTSQAMQLLPRAIMSEYPWWGLWFLQQSPPLPNMIWAAALAATRSPYVLAVLFTLFQAALSSATALLMSILFVRVGVPRWIGLALALSFFLGSDLLLLEYTAMGQIYYETMTMLLAILSCHAALSLLRSESWQASLGLGVCVAAMALTRASFSFFWPLVLLWLLWVVGWRKKRLIAAFLLPVFLLHGGWALKNYGAHHYWSWSTSSWGGANLQQGERNRSGPKFNSWVSRHPALCPSPWYELTASPPQYFFFMPTKWSMELPADVTARDQYIVDKRGAPAILDSVAARLWSQCLQTEFLQYWRTYPEIALRGTWRSYTIFWLPIRQFHVTQAFPLRADMDVYPEGLHWLRALSDAWREWRKGYTIQQRPLHWGTAPLASDFAPAKVLALPFFASFISAINFALIHSLPLLLLFACGARLRLQWPSGFSYLLLIYCYLAGLSSMVEYGENMRFRIEVEPIIWLICAVILMQWRRCIAGVAQKLSRVHAST